MGGNGSFALQDLNECEVGLCCVLAAFEPLNINDRRGLPSGEAQIVRSTTRILSAMESRGAAGENITLKVIGCAVIALAVESCLTPLTMRSWTPYNKPGCIWQLQLLPAVLSRR